jgi:hypothetical protein
MNYKEVKIFQLKREEVASRKRKKKTNKKTSKLTPTRHRAREIANFSTVSVLARPLIGVPTAVNGTNELVGFVWSEQIGHRKLAQISKIATRRHEMLQKSLATKCIEGVACSRASID